MRPERIRRRPVVLALCSVRRYCGPLMRLDVRSSSTRTFVLIPAVALAERALAHRRPRLRWAPVMIWGYLQYRLAGRYRTRRGGGGPGMGRPPERLVTTGIYSVTRNPMYLGHLVFLTGLLGATRSPVALAALAQGVGRFHRRIRHDEQRLEELFGDEYRVYAATVPRYVSAASLARLARPFRSPVSFAASLARYAHVCHREQCREV